MVCGILAEFHKSQYLDLSYSCCLSMWIINSMRMFADDIKLWADIRSEARSKSLQKDLDKLAEWSNEWQLRFQARG